MLRSTLAHEFTHLALAPLPVPLWLNEGLAQLMQEMVAEQPYFYIDRELVQRHLRFWRKHGVQIFWSGEAFNRADEAQELSYHLADVLSRNILSSHRKRFIEFVKSSHWETSGEEAACQVLGRSLASFVSEFLGPGEWAPKPITEPS